MNKYLNPKKYFYFLKNKVVFSKKSYSQAGEDLILDFLLNEKRNGFYVDVGAHHPFKLSNTYFFYKKRGWRGINIEPSENNFKLFKLARKNDTNLNIGIGNTEDKRQFFVFKESTLSTFSSENAEKYQKMGHVLVDKIPLTILPLSHVLEKYCGSKEIDFITVDTEGYDLEVLKSNNWKRFRPRFIIVETVEYKKGDFGEKIENKFSEFMKEIKYKKIADTYINTIYVRIEK